MKQTIYQPKGFPPHVFLFSLDSKNLNQVSIKQRLLCILDFIAALYCLVAQSGLIVALCSSKDGNCQEENMWYKNKVSGKMTISLCSIWITMNINITYYSLMRLSVLQINSPDYHEATFDGHQGITVPFSSHISTDVEFTSRTKLKIQHS